MIENRTVSTALEAEIRQLLIDSGDPMQVAEQFFKRWDANVLSDGDIRTLTRFLLSAGLFEPLIVQFRRTMKRDGALPWGALAETVRILDVKLEPIEVDAFFEGATGQEGGFDDLVDSQGLDVYDRRPSAHREFLLQKQKQTHQEKRNDLIRRLEYARVNRLLQQEKRVLEDLQSFDPEAPELISEKDSFAVREAQEIVESALSHSPMKSELESKYAQLPPEQRDEIKTILDQISERAASSASQNRESDLYDLALMLVFMELYSDAVALLENRRVSSRIDWLALECMLLSRHFAAALGEVETFEIKYAGDPESPFALTYARARALWGLGDTVTAIELLRSLTRVRPSYRSANTLLQQWIEEAP